MSKQGTVPDKVGRYKVLGTVGGGGMGDVYRVMDPVARREMALKILKFTYPRALHYFKREFRAVADLSHPNLVGLYDLHHENGQYFYTMELIDGVDLYMHVNRSNHVVTRQSDLCDPERLQRIQSAFVQLLRALAYLHGQGRIHRDIKPSNVLVDRQGRVKLVDFGIVKELLPGGEGQSLSQVFGTSTYFSPEQSLGSRVTSGTDLYAAGVVLYELLSGVPPFEGDSQDVARAHRDDPPPSLIQKVPCVPPDLVLVCMELLSKEPTERPSAREALEMLNAELDDEPDDEVDFVGRRASRKRMHRALETVRGGTGHLLLIEGPSGVGKKALAEAFGNEARLYGASTFTGRCVHRDHVPVRGLDTLIERIAEAYRKQTARLLRKLPDAERGPLIHTFNFLGELLPARLHGRPGRLGAGLGLHRVLSGLAKRRLLILCVEQIHLGDDALFDVLEALQTGGQLPPVMLILTVQPKAIAPHSRAAAFLELVSALPSCTRIALEPFTVDETAQMIEEQIDDVPTGLVEHVHEQTAGVPLFVREMVAQLRRSPEMPVPTFEELVGLKMRGLDQDTAEVLHAVSLCSDSVSGPILERACGLDADGLFVALRALSAAGLVRVESSSDGEIEAVPVHPRLMATVRRRIEAADAQRLHKQLARAYQVHQGPILQITHHWTAAGEPERATRFAARAGEDARKEGQHGRAAELLEVAIPAAETAEARNKLRLKWAESLALAGRFHEAAEALDVIAEVSPREGARWRARKCQLYLMAGELGAFVRHSKDLPDRARVPLADLLEPVDPVRAKALLGDAPGGRADLIRARLLVTQTEPGVIEQARAILPTLKPDADRVLQAMHALTCAKIRRAEGDLASAQAVVLRTVRRLAGRLPAHDLNGLRLRLTQTALMAERGQISEARSIGRSVLSEARERGLHGLAARASIVQARVLLEAGEPNAAARLLDTARRRWPARPVAMPHVELGLARARLRFYGGDLEGAFGELQAMRQRTELTPFLRLRRPAYERALLETRLRLTRVLLAWKRGTDTESHLAHLRPAWNALQDALPHTKVWLTLLDAVAELATWQPQRAKERLDAYLADPLQWPDNQSLLSICMSVVAAAQEALGEPFSETATQATNILREAGAARSPEARALMGER